MLQTTFNTNLQLTNVALDYSMMKFLKSAQEEQNDLNLVNF